MFINRKNAPKIILFENNKKNTNRTTYPKSPSIPFYISKPFNFLNLKCFESNSEK